MERERFFLFTHRCYYPSGGMGDYKGTFDSVALARAALESPEVKGDDGAEIATWQAGELVTVIRLIRGRLGWWEEWPSDAGSGG